MHRPGLPIQSIEELSVAGDEMQRKVFDECIVHASQGAPESLPNQSASLHRAERDLAALKDDLRLHRQMITTALTRLIALDRPPLLRFVERLVAMRRFLPLHRLPFLMRTVQVAKHRLRAAMHARRSQPVSINVGFRDWQRSQEPGRAELAAQRRQRFSREPLCSLLLVVSEDETAFLHDTLNSVRQQTYAGWELCLVAAEACVANVPECVRRSGIPDSRIRIIAATGKEETAGHYGRALEAAKGEYLAVIYAGDTLAPFALFDVVKALNDSPDADLIYSDEDRLTDMRGRRRQDPLFKPDWSPDTLRSYNYIGDLCVYSRALIKLAGGFSGNFAGCLEYDLLLRATEKARQILHIPRILYHRRDTDLSRSSAESVQQSQASRVAALAQHLTRIGVEATAEPGLKPDALRVRYSLPYRPLVSIIIPSKDHCEVLKRCIDSLPRSSYTNYEVVIIDNQSVNPSTFAYYEQLSKKPNVRIVPWNEPFNYSDINNHGVQFARGEVLLFLNNDVEVINPDWIESMLEHALRPEVGGVGAKMYYPDDRIQHAGAIIGIFGGSGHSQRFFRRDSEGYGKRLIGVQNVSAVTGACLMVRREVFEQVSGFDSIFGVAYNDMDLCLKLRQAGRLIIWTPHAELYHFESVTRGHDSTSEKRALCQYEMMLFQRKWKEVLDRGDPYYNPNLTLSRDDCSLRRDLSWPPLRRRRPAGYLKAAASWTRRHASKEGMRALASMLPKSLHLRLASWHAWLRGLRGSFALSRRRPGSRTSVPCQPFDIFGDNHLQAFLAAVGTSVPLEAAEDAARDLSGAARFALAYLMRRPSMRARFPLAFSRHERSDYLAWLCRDDTQGLKLSAKAMDNLQAAFAANLADRVRHIYDHHPSVRKAFPLGLMPAGQRAFVAWLFDSGRRDFGLRDEDIWWFVLECAEDPQAGVASTYLRYPDWQELFPLGLCAFGWRDLLHWIAQEYRIDAALLFSLPAPDTLHPVDQLRQLHHHSAAARAAAPLAFKNKQETERLAMWVQEQPHLSVAESAPWWQQLQAEIARGLAEQPGVNVISHFRYPSGLREAALATVKALHDAGIRVSCRDLPASFQYDLPGRSAYLGTELFDTTLFQFAPEPLLPMCYPLSGLAKRQDVYRIGNWYWELDTLPRSWVRYASMMHEIWAPTRFIGETLGRCASIPVFDMLPGVELHSFARLPRSHFGLPQDRYLFLFAFDMCSVMERKNPLALIAAFHKAFAGDNHVALAIKITRGEFDRESLERLTREAASNGVFVIDRVMSREESYALIDSCDCYVSLHRSEGFGLTMAEAMLMAKPVIGTAYSGNLDFMSNKNSLLVDYTRVPITQDLPFYPKGAFWAEPSVEHAAEHMRWAYENPIAARALGDKAQNELRCLLSHKAAGIRMKERLCAIRGSQTAQGRKTMAA